MNILLQINRHFQSQRRQGSLLYVNDIHHGVAGQPGRLASDNQDGVKRGIEEA
jgi:hypothetical protein